MIVIDKLNAVVWLQTGFLGDIIITTAAFRFVREHYPSLKQYVITTPIGGAALKGHPDLDGLIVFDKRGKGLLGEAKRIRKELKEKNLGNVVMLQTHRSFRSSFLCRLIGLPTITYFESQASWLAAARVSRVAVWHEAHRILLLLETLGVSREKIVTARPLLTPVESGTIGTKIREFQGQNQLIAIAPGSVWGTKRWPSEYYGALAQTILRETKAQLVILGSKDEIPAAAIVEKAAGNSERVLNLAGQTSLDDLRAVFPKLDLLISNDSSPLHYASAFRTPTLAIFGATVPALGFGPLAPQSHIAEIDIDCRPCSAHGPMTCPLGHFRCMKDQSPEKVFELVQAMI